MPSYKLTYFNFTGRGEVSRLLFTAAGQAFKDERIEFADWPALKDKTPQGTLPVLEVDGKLKISQSNAVARYLAREFKLYGKTSTEMAIIDQIVDTCVDMTVPAIPFILKGEAGKEELDTYMKEKMPKLLSVLEDLCKQAGKGGFAVGSSVTLADMALYSSFDYFPDKSFLEKSKILSDNRKAVAALPRLKKYLDARK